LPLLHIKNILARLASGVTYFIIEKYLIITDWSLYTAVFILLPPHQNCFES
jgi:hypothetical protein